MTLAVAWNKKRRPQRGSSGNLETRKREEVEERDAESETICGNQHVVLQSLSKKMGLPIFLVQATNFL